jgi:hypothetical protein
VTKGRSTRFATVIMAATIALAACGKSSTTPSTATSRSVIKLLPHGGLAANAYDLAYQGCTGKSPAEVAKAVGSTATDPAAAAAAFAKDNFDVKARPYGAKGCLDALEGRPETLPSSSPSPTPSG